MSDQEETKVDDLIMRYLKRHLDYIELESFEISYFEHACLLDKVEQARFYLQREAGDS